MSKSNVILEVTNGIWAIEPSAIDAQVALLKSFFEGNRELVNEIKEPVAFVYGAFDGPVKKAFRDEYTGAWTFGNVEPGSVAVMRVSGAIMKYDYCGAAGTLTYSDLLSQINSNPNIIAGVIIFDTPGGTVAGTEDFATKIKNSEKPIIGAVEDLMCSAGCWMGTSCKNVYALTKTSRIGSIGTMLSFADVQGAYEKQGVKFHEIYATASKDKNADFTEARKGNYKKVIESLDKFNQVFMDAVIENRGEKLNQKETLTGKVFFADEAINNGLIDGIKSMDEIIDEARSLGLQNISQSNKNNNQTQNPMKIKAAWTAMIAFFTAAFTSEVKAEDTLTEEHLEKINAELATLADVKSQLEKANADLATATSGLSTANKTIAALTSEKETLTAEVARLAALNPGASTAIKTETDKLEGAENDDAVIDAMDHNKKADANPLFGGKKD